MQFTHKASFNESLVGSVNVTAWPISVRSSCLQLVSHPNHLYHRGFCVTECVISVAIPHSNSVQQRPGRTVELKLDINLLLIALMPQENKSMRMFTEACGYMVYMAGLEELFAQGLA